MIGLLLACLVARAGWVPVGDSVVAVRGEAGVDSGVAHGLGPGGTGLVLAFDAAGEPVLGWLGEAGDVHVRGWDGAAWQVRYDAARQPPSAATVQVDRLVLATDGTPSVLVHGPQQELGWADLDPFRPTLFLAGTRRYEHHGEEAGVEPSAWLVPDDDPRRGRLALAIPAGRSHGPRPLVVWASTPSGWVPTEGPAVGRALATWTPAGLRVATTSDDPRRPDDAVRLRTWSPGEGWGELPVLPLQAGAMPLSMQGAPPRISLSAGDDGAPVVVQRGLTAQIWRLLGPGWALVPSPDAEAWDHLEVGRDGTLRALAAAGDGRSWEVVERRAGRWATLGEPVRLGRRLPHETLLREDPRGRPVIAWADVGGVRLRRFEEGAWRGLGHTDVGLGVLGRTLDEDTLLLALTSTGFPVLAWREDFQGPTPLRISSWDGRRWTHDAVATGRIYFPRALIDAHDRPVIGVATWEGEAFYRRTDAGWTSWVEHPPEHRGSASVQQAGWLGPGDVPVVRDRWPPHTLRRFVGGVWQDLAPMPIEQHVDVTSAVDGTPWALWNDGGGRHVARWDGAAWAELPAVGDEACLQRGGGAGFVVDGAGHPAAQSPPCVHDGRAWRALPLPFGTLPPGRGLELVGGGRRLVGTWVADTGEGLQVRVAAWDGAAWRSLDDDPWADVSRCPGGCGPATVAARGRHVCAAWLQPSVGGDALALRCATL